MAELDEAVAERLRRLAGSRLTLDDEIVIDSREHRSREMNRRAALEKLKELLEKASVKPRRRKRTRPTATSREKRITAKKQLSQKKQLRKKPEPL